MPAARPGLTLLELVVVLAILSVLALVAVLATDGVVDQGRYEVTRQTLDNVQTAVLGQSGQTDAQGNRIVSGFVADTGIWPLTTTDSSDTAFGELFVQPARLEAFAFRVPPASDPDVQLPSGWRGPYLRLPPTSALLPLPRLLDGWGNPFLINGTTNPGSGIPIVNVQSDGGPPPYNVTLHMSRQIVPAEFMGNLSVSVEDVKTVSMPDMAIRIVTVSVFVPDARTLQPGETRPRGLRVVSPNTGAAFTQNSNVTFSLGTVPPSWPPPVGFTIDNVIPVGTVAVRAYSKNGGTTTSSPLKYVRVAPGETTPVTIKFNIP